MAEERQRERVDVEFRGNNEHFNRIWRGHRFTDDEVNRLAAGEVISFEVMSRDGRPYEAWGILDYQTFTNDRGEEVEYLGFKLDFDLAPDRVPRSVCGHVFTDDERRFLEAGDRLHLTDLVSKRTGNTFEADVIWGDDNDRPGHKRILLKFD